MRDDLDDLPDLIDGILRDTRDWPQTALTPDSGLAARLCDALGGLHRATGQWPDWLGAVGDAVAALEAFS